MTSKPPVLTTTIPIGALIERELLEIQARCLREDTFPAFRYASRAELPVVEMTPEQARWTAWALRKIVMRAPTASETYAHRRALWRWAQALDGAFPEPVDVSTTGP